MTSAHAFTILHEPFTILLPDVCVCVFKLLQFIEEQTGDRHSLSLFLPEFLLPLPRLPYRMRCLLAPSSERV